MRHLLTTLLFLTMAANIMGCISAEDAKNAKRKAELDLEQAELIVDGDCTASNKALDAWYEENKAEADPIEEWWKTKSDGEKDSLMADHQEMRKKTFQRTITMTIRCGFAPLAGNRNR